MSNTNSNLPASSTSASCAANSARVLKGRLLLSSVNKYKTSKAARSFSGPQSLISSLIYRSISLLGLYG